MFRMKHLVLATALILCAVGAMANNFRAADQIYIPVAGHAVGGGSLFLSDLFIQNVRNEPVTISYIFIPQGDNQPATNFNDVFTLQALERREIKDFLFAARTQAGGGLGLTGAALGSVIINACRSGGNCLDSDPNTGEDTDFREVVAFSRIYAVAASAPNPQAANTTGQAFPGIPWYSYASMKVPTSAGVGDVSKTYITGFRATGTSGNTYRSNFGFMNTSQFSNATVIARLFRGDQPTTQLGTTFTMTLGPLENGQQNIANAFGITPGPTMTNLFVVVEQTGSTPTNDAPQGCLADGCPGYLAYGSVLDNATTDATTLEAVFDKPLNDAAIRAIFGEKAGGGALIRRAVRR